MKLLDLLEMDLYSLHDDPSSLNHHDVAHDQVPELIWDKYRHQPAELKKREAALAKDPEIAYWYALYVLKGPFKLGEPEIAKDAVCTYWYARDVLKGPFKLGEPAIAKDAECAYYYAYSVLKGPFKLGEPAIAKNAECAYSYAKNVLKISKEEFLKRVKINENLDSKVDFTVLHDSSSEYSIQADIGGRTIEFNAHRISSGGVWSVEFAEIPIEHKDDPLKYRNTNMTGSGNQFQVFAFVSHAFLDLIKKRSPEAIVFEGSHDDQQRDPEKLIKIYRKLTAKINDYKTYEVAKSGVIHFKLVKKGPKHDVSKMLAGVK
jgi:hypothetical protein